MAKFSDEQIAQINEIVAQAIAAANSCKCNAITDEECSDKEVAPRPLGVWCLTENYRAIKPMEWEKQNNGEQCIGIGVLTDKTAYIVSLMPTPSLPLGSTKVTEYPDICYDKETFDNEAVTEAFLEAQTSCEGDVFYWADDKRYPYRDCPAINNLPAPITSSFGTISWVLPTLATMKDIASRIGDINAAIFAVGGIVVSPYYHWTCTVNKDDKESAFIVGSDDGLVISYSMYDDYNVRAVSAFHFENFKF
ncbi:MAG: hypothetical protein IKJ08_07105 [Alistipes sp.]|nr:hypothetical protein [Alistipes sp.]MBR4029336.1 hypothetical protein [Alistipes sp.]